jgi:hypothetical protein
MTAIDQVRSSTQTGWLMPASRAHHHRFRALLVLFGAVSALLCAAPAAHAAAPALTVAVDHTPTTIMRGDIDDEFTVTVTNSGDAPTTGPVSATLAFPQGLQPTVITPPPPSCPTLQAVRDGAPLTCTNTDNILDPGQSAILIQGSLGVAPDAPSSLATSVTVSTGGAPTVTEDYVYPVIDRPPFGLADFSARSLDAAGEDDTAAGAHPYQATTSFRFPSFRGDGTGAIPGIDVPVANVRNIWVELPPGFVGAAAAAPRCPLVQLQRRLPQCPPGSQVGTLSLDLGIGNGAAPFYNVTPDKGYPAGFAFKTFNQTILSYPQLRPRGGGYGLNLTVPGASRFHILGVSATLWGVPSDTSHDPDRPTGSPVGGPPIPFLSNQSDCLDAQPTSKIYVDSWEHPARMQSDGTPDLTDPYWKSSSAPAPAITGCDNPLLVDQFKPTISAGPTSADDGGSTAADTPTGYHVDLAFPQSNDPTDLNATFDPSIPQAPQLKDATVTLPAGTAISPSAADGLDGCSDVPGSDQVRLDDINPVTCPDASKIGSVVGKSPLLAAHDPDTDAVTGAEPIDGDIYLVKPHPGDLSPSGDQDGRFRILIQLENERYGLNIKLPGIVTADKSTGQLTARFTNNPQLPVKTLHLEFKGGARAPLVNSPLCTNDATTTGVFTPWSRGGVRTDGTVVPGTPDAAASSSFAVDKGANGGACASAVKDLPFSPSFSAGVLDPQGGGSSPFVLRFARKDGEQDLGSIDTTLPPGLLANIRAVPRCPEAQAAAGTCDGASQVGTTTVGAGAGANPLFVPQPGKSPTAVYLAGPYRDAPFSLSIVVPAQAGPFDLGTVVVRAALYVDPVDGHATVKSDPLPTVRDGVPLRARDVRVNIDRPGFMVLPTNCAPMVIGADIRSAVGAVSQALEPFQGKNCSALDLKPRLDLSLSGKGQTTDDKHPAVTANLTQGSGQSNLKKVRVSLPLSLALDPDNANGLCEFVDGSKVEPTCPASSIVGQATARTPILDQPLSGPVYFVKNVRIDAKLGRQIKTLPKLVIPLTGENGVKLTLTGTSNVEDDHLVTTFDNIPDAPVSSFKLDIAGGKHGILVVSGADICAATQIANQGVEGQNLKQANIDIPIKTPSCPVKIITKKVGKTSVTVKVGGLGAGKVTVSGTGIKKTSKTIVTSTVATITAKRTKGHLGKVKISFLAKGAKKAKSTTASLVAKGSRART